MERMFRTIKSGLSSVAKYDATLAPATGGIDKVRRKARFSAPGHARDENTGAAIITVAAEHRVQTRHAA